jgi:hypothetical protein
VERVELQLETPPQEEQPKQSAESPPIVELKTDEFSTTQPVVPTRRLPKVAIVVGIGVLMVAGYLAMTLMGNSASRQFDQLKSQVTSAIMQGDTSAASDSLGKLRALGIRGDEVSALNREIDAAKKLASSTLREAQERLRARDLTKARTLLDSASGRDKSAAGIAALKTNLEKLEQQRDRTLGEFRQCIQSDDLDCAKRQALLLRTIDVSLNVQDDLRLLEAKSRSSDSPASTSPNNFSAQAALTPPQARQVPQVDVPRKTVAPSPPPQAQAAPQVDVSVVVCQKLVESGRKALASSSYDQAMSNARDALAESASCPGAQALANEARQKKDEARRGIKID